MQQIELFDQDMPKDTQLLFDSHHLWRLNQARRAIDRLYFAYDSFNDNYLQKNKDNERVLYSPYSFDSKLDAIDKAIQDAFLQIINMQSELVFDQNALSDDLNKALLDEAVSLISAVTESSERYIRTDNTAVIIDAELKESNSDNLLWLMLKSICQKNLRIVVKPNNKPNEWVVFWNTSIDKVFDKVKGSKTKCVINFFYKESDEFMASSITATLVND